MMHCISDAAERTKNERHLSLQGQKELGLSVVGSPSEIILQSPRLELTLSLAVDNGILKGGLVTLVGSTLARLSGC